MIQDMLNADGTIIAVVKWFYKCYMFY